MTVDERVDTYGARRVADALLRWATRRGDDASLKINISALRDQLEAYFEAMDEYMEGDDEHSGNQSA